MPNAVPIPTLIQKSIDVVIWVCGYGVPGVQSGNIPR